MRHPFALQTEIASDVARHQQFTDQFDRLVGEIRALPGFERFLMRPTNSECMKIAEEDSIVVFSVSKGQSNAMIVTKDQIRSLFLPDLTVVNIEENVNRLHSIIENRSLRKYRTAKSEMKKILGWLWDVAICPVLEELGFTETSNTGDPWPRVWWMPTGLLSLFPLHAAGYHEPQSKNNTLDRVISSYTPIIRALGYSRERASMAASVLRQKMVMIGMPSTPDKSNLSFIKRELSKTNNVIPPEVRRLSLCNPTKQDVVSELRDCQIVHFACHGESEIHNPSRLLLEDWQTDPLMADEVSTLEPKTAQLTFLSSCHAARCRDLQLLDEAIHLSAAFQLAGFPHVIGTLWQINDFHSTTLAKNVYGYLSEGTNIDVSHLGSASLRSTEVKGGDTENNGICNISRR